LVPSKFLTWSRSGMHEFTSPFVDEKLNLLQSVPFFALKPNLDKWPVSGIKIRPKTLKSWIKRDLYKTYIVYIVDLDRLISRPETNLIQLTKVYEAYTGFKFPVSPNFCSSFTNVDRIVCENEDTVKSYYYEEFLFAYRETWYVPFF